MAHKGLFLSACCDAGGKSYSRACIFFGIFMDVFWKVAGGLE